MSRLTRWGAGLFAVLLVAAGTGRAADLDPVLPAETESVMAVNLRQIVDSNLIKKYVLGQLKQAMAGNDVAKQLQELGLDPLKDIDRVTVGSWGDGEDANVVAVIRGKFDLDKMFAAAEQQAKTNGDKWKIVTEGKYKLVQATLSDDQPKPAFFTFADDKTIVGSMDKKQTVAAAEAAKAGGKPQLSKDVAALVLKQDDKASMYACAVVAKDKFKGLPPGVGAGIPGVDANKLTEQLKSLRSYAVTLRLTDDVSLELDAGMADTEAANDFGQSLSQLIGTAKGFLPLIAGQPNMKPLVDEITNTLKSSVKDKDVTLSLKLSGDAIGKAAGSGD